MAFQRVADRLDQVRTSFVQPWSIAIPIVSLERARNEPKIARTRDIGERNERETNDQSSFHFNQPAKVLATTAFIAMV